jgi:prepilin-type N-terminal cleavage/methylation domain-containing protein
MRTKGFTLIELMVVVVIIGVLASIATPNFMRMQGNAKEANVKSNCHLVQLASEEFAIGNDGVYAADLSSTTLNGETIIDLLPWNTRLKNPFTRNVTEPIDGAAAGSGETGYEPVVDVNGINVGYVVSGYGSNSTVCQYSNGQ